jgi:hypothetical protein
MLPAKKTNSKGVDMLCKKACFTAGFFVLVDFSTTLNKNITNIA